MKLFRKIFLSFFIILSASSTLNFVAASMNTPEKIMGKPMKDKALIYFIRPSLFLGSARTQFLYADNIFLGTVDNNTYSFAYLEPGSHLIWSNWTNIQKQMDFFAGKTYYLRIFPTMEVLDSNQAESTIASEIKSYATATEKEKAKAVIQIKNRLETAKRRRDTKTSEYSASINVPEPQNEEERKAGSIPLKIATPVKVSLLQNLTSKFNKPGDEVLFEVSEAVKAQGQILIAQGTPVKGKITHITHGKAGGIPGNVDISIYSIKAVDGSMVPMSGQVFKTGTDRSSEATARGMYFGLIGLMTVKSREAYLLAPESFEISTSKETWIVPKTISVTKETPLNSFSQEALIERQITFTPATKKNIPDVIVKAPGEGWDNLQLIQVNNYTLPKPIASTKLKDSNQFVFNGWEVAKFLPFNTDKKSFALAFKGTQGNKVYKVKSKITTELQLK